MATPVAIPKLVVIGAEQSCRRRTMTWQGIATRSSKTLPFSNQEVSRVSAWDELREYT
jgi:hypothetical protein